MRTRYVFTSKEQALHILDGIIRHAKPVQSTKAKDEWEAIIHEKTQQMRRGINRVCKARYRCYDYWRSNTADRFPILMKQTPRITITISRAEFSIIRLHEPLSSFRKQIKKASKGLFL